MCIYTLIYLCVSWSPGAAARAGAERAGKYSYCAIIKLFKLNSIVYVFNYIVLFTTN